MTIEMKHLKDIVYEDHIRPSSGEITSSNSSPKAPAEATEASQETSVNPVGVAITGVALMGLVVAGVYCSCKSRGRQREHRCFNCGDRNCPKRGKAYQCNRQAWCIICQQQGHNVFEWEKCPLGQQGRGGVNE